MQQLPNECIPPNCQFIRISKYGGIDYYKKGNQRILKWKRSTSSWEESRHRDVDDLYSADGEIRVVYRYTYTK